jgi:hypothetical protein
LDREDFKDFQVRKGRKDREVIKVILDYKALLDLKGRRDHKDRKVIKV